MNNNLKNLLVALVAFSDEEYNSRNLQQQTKKSFNARHASISIIPHITGLLSVLGSLYIVIDVLRDKKKRSSSTFHRILLGMSVSDLIASLAMAMSTWPVPSIDSGVLDGGNTYGAMGNQGTCTTQGFFVQFGGLATPLYSAFLSVYYILVIKYGWNDRGDAMLRLEKIFHCFAWGLAISTAVASLFLQLYNNANIWCWIAPLPLDCVTSVEGGINGITNCVRGDNAWVYRLAFFFIWLWLSVITVTVCMTVLVFSVYSQFSTASKYDIKGTNSKTNGQNTNKNLRRVAVQAALYIGSFFLTAIFPSIVRMIQAKWNCTSEYYPLSLLTVTFFPLQGFWNFAIYARPQILQFVQSQRTSFIDKLTRVAEKIQLTVWAGSSYASEFKSSSDTTTNSTAAKTSIEKEYCTPKDNTTDDSAIGDTSESVTNYNNNGRECFIDEGDTAKQESSPDLDEFYSARSEVLWK